MKVKIKNSKGLKFSREPILFDLKLKDNGKVIMRRLSSRFYWRKHLCRHKKRIIL